MICPNCGNPVNATDTYCSFCGARLHRQVEAAHKPSSQFSSQSHIRNPRNNASNDKSINSKKNLRALLLSILGIILAIVVATFIFKYINHRNEEALWTEAVENKQINSFRTYLEKYPSGEHSDEAREILNKLISEKETWENASTSGNEDLLRAYIRNNPTSTHLEEARELLDDAVWTRVSSCKTKEAYQQYIDEFPNGKHVAEARNLLEDIEEKERAVLTTAEYDNVKSTVSNFLMGLELWDSNLIISTCNSEMTDFMGKRPATISDVRDYYDAFAESDIDSIGFSSLNVDVKKNINSEKRAEYKVTFSTTRKILRRDHDAAAVENMRGQAIVDDRFHFNELTIGKEQE